MASAALRRGACPQSYRMYCFVQIVAVWDQGSLPSAARGQSIRKWRPHPPAESPGPSTCTSAAAVANLAPAKDGLREVMLASSLPQKSREDDGTRERSTSSVLGLSGMERNGHTRRDEQGSHRIIVISCSSELQRGPQAVLHDFEAASLEEEGNSFRETTTNDGASN